MQIGHLSLASICVCIILTRGIVRISDCVNPGGGDVPSPPPAFNLLLRLTGLKESRGPMCGREGIHSPSESTS